MRIGLPNVSFVKVANRKSYRVNVAKLGLVHLLGNLIMCIHNDGEV